MALYRTGTAAMDAQGVITGTGTKWREPLSLIRTGATIVFLTTPLKLAVISDIVSDTEMKAIQTDGESVANGNYVILLNDSLTVDGMAQDVAETLRYYQSKETVIEEALDFFKDFDLQGLKYLVKQVADSADAAKLSETNAAQSAQNTLEIKNQTKQLKADTNQIKNQTEQLKADTNQIKQETQSIKDGAVGEINTAKQAAVVEIGTNKDSALQAITDSKTSVIAEMNIIKEETLDARDLAEAAQEGAERAETAANNAQTGAETARDKAEQWANSINPENLLHKDMNLSDLSDRAAAWLNVRPIGSTPLSGDPVNDYDAATKRWVQNLVNTGTVGPTMNGVMNYGVGDFHLRDSRAFIKPYEVVSDGQLLNRADWPELWAYAQMLTPITDAEWLADHTKRGKYSLGNGTTTFRVPDRNGVQSGSIGALFARGDGGSSSDNGIVYKAAVPNITGRAKVAGGSGGLDDGEGSLLTNDGPGSAYGPITTVSVSSKLHLDASVSDSVYGRDGIKDDVLPRNFVGVWVIRASGGFVAANTSWSVINGDTTEPDNNTIVYGGDVWSTYKVAGSDYVKLGYRSKVTIGGESTGEILLVDSRTGGVSKTWEMPTGSGTLLSTSDIGTYGNKIPKLDVLNIWSRTQVFQEAGLVTQSMVEPSSLADKSGPHHVSYVMTGNTVRLGAKFYANFAANSLKRAIIHVTTDNDQTAQIFAFDETGNIASSRGVVTWTGSDVRIKDRFEPPKPGAWDRVKQIGVMEFYYKGSHVLQRGFLAQQMIAIDDTYVFFGGTAKDDNGEEFEIMNVNDRAVISDLIVVVQELQKDNEEMKEEIAEMKAAMSEMKVILAQLTK